MVFTNILPRMEVKNVESMLYNIFSDVVEAVMTESALPFERLAHGRDERSVNARVVLVDVLLSVGMTEGDIVRASGMSQQMVNGLKNAARHRLKGLYGRMLRDAVRKRCANLLGN